jgi:oxidase EvaA
MMSQSASDIEAWLCERARALPYSVAIVPLCRLQGWSFAKDPLRIVHVSGKFFKIRGMRISAGSVTEKAWDQPIIDQPEIGILGLLARRHHGTTEYLVQAKSEPGNIMGPQLSPTVQATVSNYTAVHGGRLPLFLQYFLDESTEDFIVDQLQGEQTSRFYRKRNRNMVRILRGDCDVPEDFRWMTLCEIKEALTKDNLVNMPVRSIISCLPIPELLPGDGRRLSPFADQLRRSALQGEITEGLRAWMASMEAGHRCSRTWIGLDSMNGWITTEEQIRDEANQYFSVVGVDVEIANREVTRWSQPLVFHTALGLNGMITQMVEGLLRFLIRACVYPGTLGSVEYTATVCKSSYVESFGRQDSPMFLDLFRDADPGWVRYSGIQSEEGGRFLHYQNRYVVLELPEKTIGVLPHHFQWMTLGQISRLLADGHFTIEARNILSCLSFQ